MALDREHREQHQRRRQQQQQGRTDQVERALRPPERLLSLRALEVDQRQAGHRAHGHPLAGDVGDARRDDHLDVLVLQGPLGAPQVDRAPERASGHDDRVGAHPGRRLGGPDRLPDVRHPDGRGLEVALVVGAQGADDAVAEPGLAVHDRGDLVDVREVAGHQHPVQEQPATPGGVQATPQQHPAEDQQRHPDQEAEHEEAAREGHLAEVADDAHEAGGDGRAVDDVLVLLDAGAQLVGAVGAEEREHRDPAADHVDRDLGDQVVDVVGAGEEGQPLPQRGRHQDRGEHDREVQGDAEQGQQERASSPVRRTARSDLTGASVRCASRGIWIVTCTPRLHHGFPPSLPSRG